eukprot:10450790-Ditylum_brightwellii.AAC.1
MPTQCLPPTDQSKNDGGIAVPSLPPMISVEGPSQSEFATAASTQQERSPSTLLALPTKFSPVTTVLFSSSKKNE